MDFALYLRYGPALASGFAVTLLCWFGGAALGLALGFVVALLQRLSFAPLRWLTRTYIEVVRGTPFLVQLFVLYDGGPSFGLRLDATSSGILALGIYGSAYFAEIFRAGFNAVPPGQVEAAASLGMAPFTILRRIRLPVMLVAIVPALTNMLIILSKETVVLSIITVPELMYQMQTMAAETFAAFETILAMAILYWIMVELVARAGRVVERRVTAFMTGAA
ncbi:amino acid ABC transporter permease [Limobrevibacterium gyesilva]|uniref:Amino acid ABC transporter permease n=1 Tax=Limobrevibacterium gyesilva TaxID=2991712 RepID=A0AA42CHW9_9PROT|nr:amino acid ABC transporter permease [Limobrevibacterium gyesilva]MCW3475310.1 amino acid ABC transporter permease [Limobrevibacterium gyesilva]